VTAERWERVKQIVADALDLGRDDRPQFLQQQCGADLDLRHDVETLLSADEPNSGFLELDRPPEQIGPYRVVREIGRGGMGTVYLGERADGQFEQRVAIKVIKRGMDTDAVLRRFYAERQILARLQHPNITRLLDGGMVDNRPFFVMEYLEGEPLGEYCRSRKLPVRERIRLFLSVCDAVEYAHRNLILHRDLKNGNILVDADGTPKLLDFGIAKLLAEDGAEQSVVAARPLTPQAASPEQIQGIPLTTASDVYGLGLLLFELLAGEPPYRVSSLSAAEMVHQVCDRPVPKPSMVAAATVAKLLRGDLDNIVLKALEKEPGRRYQHPAELAADLRRHLDGRPIEARAGGALYRARKFVLRHRRSLAVAALAVVALAAAVGDAIVQGRRAARRFDDLRQLAGSFLFEFHDAIATLPGSTPARELVVKRATQYLDSLAREASSDIGLKREAAAGYQRVGEAQGGYFEANLGKSSEARVSFQKSVALYEEVLRARPNDPQARTDLAHALLGLATTDYGGAGDVAAGMATLRRVVDLLESGGRKQPLDARALVALGQAYFGISERQMHAHQDADALQSRLRSLEVLRAARAADPGNADALRWLAQSEKRLAYLYLQQLNDVPKAEENLRASLEIDQQRAAREPGNPPIKLDLALDHSYLAAIARRKGDLPLFEQLLDQTIAARAAVLAADPRNFRALTLLLGDYSRMGAFLRDQNRLAESRAVFDKGLKLAAAMDPAIARNADAVDVVATLRREAEKARSNPSPIP
jgi:non-specific serine/threonine protein kinase/serine/threonine-protein kinase